MKQVLLLSVTVFLVPVEASLVGMDHVKTISFLLFNKSKGFSPHTLPVLSLLLWKCPRGMSIACGRKCPHSCFYTSTKHAQRNIFYFGKEMEQRGGGVVVFKGFLP